MIDSKNDNDGKSKCNKTHLQLEQRKQILEQLHQGFNQETIAKTIGVHKTTVSRELLLHRKEFPNKRKRNNCEKIRDCDIKHICPDMKCTSKCKKTVNMEKTAGIFVLNIRILNVNGIIDFHMFVMAAGIFKTVQ